MSCPIIFNSNTIELTVHTSCYLGLRLTLCYRDWFSIKIRSVCFLVLKFEVVSQTQLSLQRHVLTKICWLMMPLSLSLSHTHTHFILSYIPTTQKAEKEHQTNIFYDLQCLQLFSNRFLFLCVINTYWRIRYWTFVKENDKALVRDCSP